MIIGIAPDGDADPETGVCEPSVRELVRDVLSRVGDKWSLIVVNRLDAGPRRFTAIQDEIEGISHRMLTRTLRGLERDGLVSRHVFAEVPPRVEYALTPLGRSFGEPVRAIVEWVEAHQQTVEANRAEFDAR